MEINFQIDVHQTFVAFIWHTYPCTTFSLATSMATLKSTSRQSRK